MSGKRKVPRRGGVVFRGGTPHLRRDHATTVPGLNGTVSDVGRPDVGGLLEEGKPPARPPKPLGFFGVNVYSIIISLRGGKSVHLGGGRGVARFTERNTRRRVERVGPYANIHGPGVVYSGDFSGFNLSDSTFSFEEIHRFNFSDSTLDGSVFKNGRRGFSPLMLMDSINWRGASLRNVTFHNNAFTGYCDFRDTDFTGVTMPKTEFFSGVELDFRGSNVTGEQIDDIFDMMPVERSETGKPVYGNRYKLIYDKYTLDEAAELTGLDQETLGVLVWSGAVEIRDENNHKVVDPSEFTPSKHVIPGWELRKLVKGTQIVDGPSGET